MTDSNISLNRSQLAQFFSTSPQAVKAFEQLFIAVNNIIPGTIIEIINNINSDSSQLSEAQATIVGILAGLLTTDPPRVDTGQADLFLPPVEPAVWPDTYTPPQTMGEALSAYQPPYVPQGNDVYTPPYCLDLNSEMTSWLSSLPTSAPTHGWYNNSGVPTFV